MKREISWGSVAVIAFAAFIGVSSQYGGKPPVDTNAAAKPPGKASAALPAAKDPFDQGPCTEIEERLQTFLLNGSRESRAAPQFCYDPQAFPKNDSTVGEKLREAGQKLHFVIAILPDPVHSHFSLSFDRFVEAVQQGASDERYVYDSSWLPWDTEHSSYALIQDQDKADDRQKLQEEQPGILLFRKKADPHAPADPLGPFRDGLAIFVVGDEPTQGVHRAQFKNAAAWIAALLPRTNYAPPQFKLPDDGILGPSFSGSLPSLASLLNELLTMPSGKTVPIRPADPLRIYSGDVSGRNGVEHFVKSVLAEKTHFASFEQNDDVLIDKYCRYLHSSKFNLNRLAIISEDETAYGSEVGTTGAQSEKPFPNCSEELVESPQHYERSPRFFYPRDISALRAAYQKQSIFNSQPSPGQTEPGRRTLTTDIADPEGEQHDTIRSYNNDQTAQSQEAVLQQIVSQLRAHQSEYILLRSSNPLDQLFLAHYLRLAYPQGRVVILGADLLLRRESGAARLSGIMTLTNYPLLPWESHWTKSPNDSAFHTHRVFPQDGAEGTYIATRFLLHRFFVTADQNVTIDAISDQLNSTGYTEKKPPAVLSKGSYSVNGNDIEVWPSDTCDQAESVVTIHVENNLVKSLTDKQGKNLSGCEFAPHLVLQQDVRFLPTNPLLRIPDYTTPFWIRDPNSSNDIVEQTPVWLSVLGRNDFWPLAALDDYSLGDKPSEPSQMGDRGHYATIGMAMRRLEDVVLFWRATPAYQRNDPYWAPMPLSMRIALSALFIWACFHFACCCWPSITAKPSHRAYFVCFAQSFGAHRTLLVLGSLALSSTATVLAWGYGALSPDGVPLNRPWRFVALLLLLWLLAGASLMANLWRQADVKPVATKRALRSRAPTKVPWSFLWPPLALIAGTLSFYLWFYSATEAVLTPANRIPVYWRDMNLTSGVSPVVPIVALTLGFYMWFWYALQGLAFFGPDAPVLPANRSLEFPGEGETMLNWLRMFSREFAGEPVQAQCSPFAKVTMGVGLVSFISLTTVAKLLSTDGEEPIRSLGARSYGQFVCVLVAASVSLMLANAWQLLHIWLTLRRLLIHLDRLPLRRSMAAFPGVSWGSVWKISGNVLDMRYKLLVSQLECLTHLQNSLASTDMKKCPFWKGTRSYAQVEQAIADLHVARVGFAKWYSKVWDQINEHRQDQLNQMQYCLAEVAGKLIVWMLVPAWQLEDQDLLPDAPSKASDVKGEQNERKTASAGHLAPHLSHAERLVSYVYLGFIQNTLGRMRTIVIGILWLFISATISLASYPFDPRPVVNGVMVLLFFVLGSVIVFVYAQMHRDAILSLVTNTKPGELDSSFWIKLISVGTGPALGLAATIFPELTDFLFSWVAPGVLSMK